MTAKGHGDLEARLARLEAEREIERVVHAYARACDPIDPERIAALFTEDATWGSHTADGSVDFGRFEGRDGIREGFVGLAALIDSPTLHTVSQPSLEVDLEAGTARGEWYTLVVTRPRPAPGRPGEPILLGAVYEHEYRREGGRWLIASLDTVIQFMEPLGAARGSSEEGR